MYELLEFGSRGILLGVTYGLLAFPISLLFIATDTVDLAVGGYAVLAGAVAMFVGESQGAALGIMMGILAGVLASASVGCVSLLLGRRRSPRVQWRACWPCPTPTPPRRWRG